MNNDLNMNEYEERKIYVEETRKMGILEKFKYLFISPSKAFENIKAHPNMLSPLIIAFVISILIGLASINIVKLATQKTTDLMSDLMETEIPVTAVNFDTGYIIQLVIMTPIAIALSWILYTFFLWLINKIFGGKATFTMMLSLTSHLTMFSSAVGLIAIIPQIIMNTDINIFSFAILYPSGNVSEFLYNILNNITLPTIWITIVTAIGLTVINGYDKTKGYLTSFIYYILNILILAATTTIPFIMLQNLNNS